jgi:hypothetical protein
MSKSRKQPLISYAEYRLREAYDEDQEQAEDDWSFEDAEPMQQVAAQEELSSYAPADQGQEWNWEGDREDTPQDDLGTLGMSQHPTFAQMPERGNELAAAGGPGPDEDPEDWQAKQDLEEVSGVYGLKLGSTKSGNLVIQKAGLSSWRQDFPDYVSAMQWIKQNMGKVSSR